jgi:AraC-like DNA-binding protein
LLDGLRHRLALQLIREGGLSVKQASWRLGFSEPAAFSRAFKRWTGSAPSAARA